MDIPEYMKDYYKNRHFNSSGVVHVNTSGTPYVKVPEVKKNCENCGSNHIEGNECKHCGTWYGYGQKPKPYKLPPVNPQRIERYESPKPQSFFQRIFSRKH